MFARSALACLALTVSLEAGRASAATPFQGSLIVDRGRADRAAPPPPPTPAPTGAGAALPAAAAFTPFRVREVRVEGSSAPAALVGLATRPFIGRTVDAASINALPDAVAKAYALTDVALYTVLLPRQSFENGSVRIVVIEGHVEGVDVQGGRRVASLGRVRALAARLVRDRPLRRSHLQRALLLIQAVGGDKVEAGFLPGRAPGAVRLKLAVTEKRVQLGLGISDRGQNLLGRTQLEADLTLNSLLRQGDQTLLTFATPTDPRRFRYYALSHSEPIGADGLTVGGSIGYLETRPRGTNLRGQAETAAVTASYPLILGATRTLSATLSLDGLNSRNALFGQTLSNERTRAVRAAAAFAGAKGPTTLTASGAVSFGLDFADARTLAPGYDKLDFAKLSGQARVERRLGPWSVRARATGQYSPDLLPASEQLALGGDEYGRAFAAAVVTGDEGAAGSVELGRAVKAPLPAVLDGSELYGFVDGGRLRLRSRPELGLPGRTYDLASTGLGVRMLVAKRAQFQLEAAKALQDPDVAETEHDWRLVFAYRTNY